MDIQTLRDNGLILLEAISGSRAYGLATPSSDTDIKGVFILPRRRYFGLRYIPQVHNVSQDVVFYEWGRFMELLAVNNPNILELLNTPDHALLYRHPILAEVRSELILSKLCEKTFGKFALSQIKKARGLNKKIVNPMGRARKSLLEFCYVQVGQGSQPLPTYLAAQHLRQEDCGLVNIPHMRDLYALFHGKDKGYKGIIQKEHSQDVSLSSVPKGEQPIAMVYVNRDGYSTYCKDYKAYWDWVAERNEARYQGTLSHGQNYDAKNMMHTFRLLEMAIEIGREQVVRVQRPNRDFLLGIKAGQYAYPELMKMAERKQQEMTTAFAQSDLPEAPDWQQLDALTSRLRLALYQDPRFQ